MKTFVCTCEQCKSTKNKRKNRNTKRMIRRLVNKKIRKGKEGEVYNHYWA